MWSDCTETVAILPGHCGIPKPRIFAHNSALSWNHLTFDRLSTFDAIIHAKRQMRRWGQRERIALHSISNPSTSLKIPNLIDNKIDVFFKIIITQRQIFNYKKDDEANYNIKTTISLPPSAVADCASMDGWLVGWLLDDNAADGWHGLMEGKPKQRSRNFIFKTKVVTLRCPGGTEQKSSVKTKDINKHHQSTNIICYQMGDVNAPRESKIIRQAKFIYFPDYINKNFGMWNYCSTAFGLQTANIRWRLAHSRYLISRQLAVWVRIKAIWFNHHSSYLKSQHRHSRCGCLLCLGNHFNFLPAISLPFDGHSERNWLVTPLLKSIREKTSD